MLKTNSKKAKENLKNYIMQYTDYLTEYGYNKKSLNDYTFCCYLIFKIFKTEMSYNFFRNNNCFETFKKWAQGLAMGDLFCFLYNREAKNDLKFILEETEKEQEKFTESQAELFLIKLIYNEAITGYNKFMSKTK